MMMSLLLLSLSYKVTVERVENCAKAHLQKSKQKTLLQFRLRTTIWNSIEKNTGHRIEPSPNRHLY